MSLARSSELLTGLPSIEVMMSPPIATCPFSTLPLMLPARMPAFSAGVPGYTLCTSAPLLTGRFSADSEPSIVSDVSPM